ncbi:hypothetical protein FRB90_001276 [Tulasnella sp. 427]|nr:hypothetical protein FRB90_001276 [Tulasnella sp. 427]
MKLLTFIIFIMAFGPKLFNWSAIGRDVLPPTQTYTAEVVRTAYSPYLGQPMLGVSPTGGLVNRLDVGNPWPTLSGIYVLPLVSPSGYNTDWVVSFLTAVSVITRRIVRNVDLDLRFDLYPQLGQQWHDLSHRIQNTGTVLVQEMVNMRKLVNIDVALGLDLGQLSGRWHDFCRRLRISGPSFIEKTTISSTYPYLLLTILSLLGCLCLIKTRETSRKDPQQSRQTSPISENALICRDWHVLLAREPSSFQVVRKPRNSQLAAAEASTVERARQFSCLHLNALVIGAFFRHTVAVVLPPAGSAFDEPRVNRPELVTTSSGLHPDVRILDLGWRPGMSLREMCDSFVLLHVSPPRHKGYRSQSSRGTVTFPTRLVIENGVPSQSDPSSADLRCLVDFAARLQSLYALIPLAGVCRPPLPSETFLFFSVEGVLILKHSVLENVAQWTNVFFPRRNYHLANHSANVQETPVAVAKGEPDALEETGELIGLGLGPINVPLPVSRPSSPSLTASLDVQLSETLEAGYFLVAENDETLIGEEIARTEGNTALREESSTRNPLSPGPEVVDYFSHELREKELAPDESKALALPRHDDCDAEHQRCDDIDGSRAISAGPETSPSASDPIGLAYPSVSLPASRPSSPTLMIAHDDSPEQPESESIKSIPALDTPVESEVSTIRDGEIKTLEEENDARHPSDPLPEEIVGSRATALPVDDTKSTSNVDGPSTVGDYKTLEVQAEESPAKVASPVEDSTAEGDIVDKEDSELAQSPSNALPDSRVAANWDQIHASAAPHQHIPDALVLDARPALRSVVLGLGERARSRRTAPPEAGPSRPTPFQQSMASQFQKFAEDKVERQGASRDVDRNRLGEVGPVLFGLGERVRSRHLGLEEAAVGEGSLEEEPLVEEPVREQRRRKPPYWKNKKRFTRAPK